VEPAAARERQTLFSMQWDSGAVQAHSARSVDPVALEPLVRDRSLAEPGSPYVESVAPAAASP
jgi:hypothetical protein